MDRVRDFYDAVDELVGLTLLDAEERANQMGLRFRNMTDALGHRQDLTNGRVNIWHVDGVVTRATIF